jgi:putative ATP-binding cassette transporter
MTFNLQGFPWKRLIMVGKPFWTSEYKWRALGLLGGALACVIAKIVLTVYVNDTNGAVWSALKDGNSDNFWWYFAMNVALIVALMPTDVMGNVFKTTLALLWRGFLSGVFFAGYFVGLAALRLEQHNQAQPEDKRIDNPEWRMTAECDSFANTTIGLFFSFFDAFLTIGTMGHVLWTMSPMLTGTNIAYALAGSLVVYFLGRRLVNLTAQQQKTEGDLRSGLTEARNQAGLIALYRAQDIALGLANNRQRAVIDTLMDMMRVNRNMQFFTSLYYPLAPLIPLGIMGMLYLHDRSLDFGTIAKAQGTFNSMFGGMSVLVGQFGALSFYTAIVNRLGTLLEFFRKTGIEKLPADKFIQIVEDKQISLDLSVTNPDGNSLLIDKLKMVLKPGESVLIRGPQASGKSALLGAIIGTWPFGKGTVGRPADKDVMIITQQPFMQPMTLVQALTYPETDATQADKSRLAEILRLVDLGDLIDKDKRNLDFDTVYNWREILSLSQQQRLGLARIINKKPLYCLVDEASNAMEAENEKLLFTLFKSLGTTYLTASNGADLVKYHSWVLEINDGGSWKLVPAADYEPKVWRSLEKFLPRFLIGSSAVNPIA